ncbi:alpha/beta hydrolase [Candidatus Roizmanbacteria bacterium]|nr:alpha/beta hydrolase [Candidatus Roizmanbacteria bacterium]
MLKTTKSYLNIGYHDLYYEATGNGLPIIFAHGLGGNYLSWWQQIPYFSQNYSCISFSHQGYFRSKKIPNRVDPSEFANDLSALIDHLKLEKVILVGQSMGGWTVINYALQNPARVTAIIMASTVGPLTHPKIEPLLENYLKVKKTDALKNIHLAAGIRMAKEQPSLHFLYQEIDSLNTGVNKDELRSLLLASRNVPLEKFTKLHIPTLFLTGVEDVIVNPKAVSVLSSLIPNSKFLSVRKTGHSVYFERAQLFNSMVKSFLRK